MPYKVKFWLYAPSVELYRYFKDEATAKDSIDILKESGMGDHPRISKISEIPQLSDSYVEVFTDPEDMKGYISNNLPSLAQSEAIAQEIYDINRTKCRIIWEGIEQDTFDPNEKLYD